MDRLAQGVTNRAHRRAETEDQRIQDSHSQPHARLSTFFLRGTDEYRPVAAGTCRPRSAAVVSLGWRGPEQLPRTGSCFIATGSFRIVAWSFLNAKRSGKSVSELRTVRQASG